LGENTTLTASGASTYSWDQGLGSGGSKVVSPSTTTIYTITGTDLNGCTGTGQVSITVNSLPTVGLSANDPTLCVGESTTLTASGASTYTWNQGLGSGGSKVVSPTATTIYTITGTDLSGCTGTDQVSITVNSLPTVGLNASDPTLCVGESTTLTASGASTYAWSQGLGSGSSKTVSPSSTITYTITGTDGNGCSGTDDVAITVHPLPTVDLSASDAILCMGESTTLTASGASTYTWNQGLGSGSSKTVSPSSTTIYIVTGTDLNGCTGTGQVSITVNSLPSFNVMPYGAICAGDTALLSVSGGNAWSWSTGQSAQSILVAPAGSTTYSVTVSNAEGCSAEASLLQTVNSLPVLSLATISPFCIDDPPFIPAVVSPGGGIYSGPGIVANQFDPHFAGPGTHTLAYTFTDLNGCSADTLLNLQVDLRFRIEGGLYYDGNLLKPMDSSRVVLSGQGSGATDTLDVNSGLFSFRCLDNDLYQLQPGTQTAWGGVNATDALAAAQFSVSQLALSPLRQLAADVNGSGFVNAGDALLILRRFVNIISSFPVADWILPSSQHQVNGADLSGAVLGAICAGDVNGSYNPFGTKSVPGLMLHTRGELPQSKDLVVIEVYLEAENSPAAVSLAMKWPGLGPVTIEGLPEGSLYEWREGVLRIGAYTTDNEGFDISRPFFRLIWDPVQTFALPALLEGCEISDVGGQEQKGAGLTFALPVEGGTWSLNVLPNPVSGGGEINIQASGAQLPLSWWLHTMDGRPVDRGISGEPKFRISTRSLVPGVYLLKVTTREGWMKTTRISIIR
jgi:hypothetical protein